MWSFRGPQELIQWDHGAVLVVEANEEEDLQQCAIMARKAEEVAFDYCSY